MDPAPVPRANTVRSNVSTLPPEPSVSRATMGNSVNSVAPMVQNQLSARSDSQIARCFDAERTTSQVADRTFQPIGSEGSAAGTGRMRSAPNNPPSDKATPTAATIAVPAGSSTSAPPATVPMTIDKKVVASITPLPATNSCSSSCSGSMPYLTGPNSAAWAPRPISTASSAGTLSNKNATAAAVIRPTSASL